MSSHQNITAPSDEQLLEGSRQGDRDALQELHSRYSKKLLGFLAARCPRGGDFESLEQDVWVRVLRPRKKSPDSDDSDSDGSDSNFSGLVFKIARNLLFDFYRRQARKPETTFPEGLDPSTAPFPLEDERLDFMRECVKHLDGVFIQTLIRVKLEGVSPECIAKEEGVPRTTVDSRVHRGKQQLGACIEKKLKESDQRKLS